MKTINHCSICNWQPEVELTRLDNQVGYGFWCDCGKTIIRAFHEEAIDKWNKRNTTHKASTKPALSDYLIENLASVYLRQSRDESLWSVSKKDLTDKLRWELGVLHGAVQPFCAKRLPLRG